MQVMQLVAPGQITAVERARPAPGVGELRLRLEACGLCASELDVFLGRNPWQQYPVTLGHEGMGRVVAVGDGVSGWREGDLAAVVLGGGAYADEFIVRASGVITVPQGLETHVALAEPLACAVNSFVEIGARPGDRIVVLGAGFMGLALVQLLRGLAPEWLLVAARRDDARTLALELGAAKACSPAEVQTQVWELTGGQGADVVIEATGSEEMLALSASLLREEGTLAVVGYHQGEGRRVPVHEWNWKALRIANCHFRSQARMMDGARRGLQLAARGAIDVRRLVTHSFPLSRLQQAFETAASRPAGFVKAAIVPDQR